MATFLMLQLAYVICVHQACSLMLQVIYVSPAQSTTAHSAQALRSVKSAITTALIIYWITQLVDSATRQITPLST